MRVRRLQAMELQSGDLQVSIVISKEDRTKFFEMAPLPDDTVDLSADRPPPAPAPTPPPLTPTPEAVARSVALEEASRTVKPPTQTIAPAGKDSSAIGPTASAKERSEARSLCDHPFFQAFAEEGLGARKFEDSRVAAVHFIGERVMQGAIWDSEAYKRYRELVDEYRAWCAKKGYAQ